MRKIYNAIVRMLEQEKNIKLEIINSLENKEFLEKYGLENAFFVAPNKKLPLHNVQKQPNKIIVSHKICDCKENFSKSQKFLPFP